MEGEEPERLPGRRRAMYFYRDPKMKSATEDGSARRIAIEMKLVNRIRERVKTWRTEGYPRVTRSTLKLLVWREGRERRLFFAELATETTISLLESRADFRQGIDIPRDEPTSDRNNDEYSGFIRYACKMATGTGKTTVMGMLAALSILNKVNDRSDSRFSDVVLAVCPNVTIKRRLDELDPERGQASVYRTRDLVPGYLMSKLGTPDSSMRFN